MSASAPSLGVVIPLFNGARWIDATLGSVRAQEARIADVVVVDDGGTDDGAARAAAHPGVRVVPSLGKGRARHTGLLETRADFVAFLDQDDLWHPAHLGRLAATLVGRPEVPAAAAGWRLFRDGTTPRLDAAPGRATDLWPWDDWPVRCPVPTPSAVLFRGEALRAAGGWALDAAPDWEAYLQLTDAAPIPRLPGRTCGYRLHAHARSAALRRDGFAYLEVQRRGADASWAARVARGIDPDARARLERRRPVLEHVAGLMEGRRDDDRAGFEGAARAFEGVLAVERRAYVEACFEMIVYLFCPGDDPEAFAARRDALLRDLQDRWPPDAPRTARVLAAHRLRHRFRWRRFFRAASRGRLREARRQWRRRAGP